MRFSYNLHSSCKLPYITFIFNPVAL